MTESITGDKRNRLLGAGILLGLGAGALAAYLLAKRNGITREHIVHGARRAVTKLDTMPPAGDIIRNLAGRALDALGKPGTEGSQPPLLPHTPPAAPPMPEGQRP